MSTSASSPDAPPAPVRAAGRRSRSLAPIALAVAAVALTTACPPPPPPPDTYVAMGDSFSAGTFIANQIPPTGCFRSDHSYPHLAAPAVGLPKLVDVTCSGATTENMTQPQALPTGGANPPQLDALDVMTGLVTLTIGGNDVGYWSTVANGCVAASPVGTPCQDTFVVGGQDTISQRIASAAPKVAAVLDAIHQRAPRARVLIVAYEAIFPEGPLTPGGPEGCFPQLPYAPGDVPYLRAKQRELNAMIQQQAAAHGATFVDASTASIGHDACRTAAVRWVEPASVQGVGYALHPNVAGMTGAKDALLAAL